MLRRFGSEKDDITGEWRRLRNKELYALYSSPNIIRVIKSRLRWPEHVAHMEDPSVNGRITLKWIFEKCAGCMDRLRIQTSAQLF